MKTSAIYFMLGIVGLVSTMIAVGCAGLLYKPGMV